MMLFPKHLLLEKNGHPAFFDVLPRWLNRERKREIASKLRRKGAVRVDAPSPDKVFLAWFKKRDLRFGQFWRLIEVYDTEGTAAAHGKLSLDYSILEQAFPNFLEAETDREVIESAYPGLDDLEARVKDRYPDVVTILQPLGPWLHARAQLQNWESLGASEREILAGVLFALSGVTDSTWFMEEALRSAPGLEELFELELSRDKGLTATTGDVDAQEESWLATWRLVRSLSERALEEPRRAALADELVEYAASLKALGERRESDASPSQSVEELIEGLRQRLTESASVHRWPTLALEIVEKVIASWLIAQSSETRTEDLHKDARRAHQQLASLLQQADALFAALTALDEQLGTLAKRVAETRTPAERRRALEERDRAEGEQLRLLSALEDLETEALQAASPFRAFEPSRNYVAELHLREKEALGQERVTDAGAGRDVGDKPATAPGTVDREVAPRAEALAEPTAGGAPAPVEVPGWLAPSGAPTESPQTTPTRIAGDEGGIESSAAAPGDNSAGGVQGEASPVFGGDAGARCKPIWEALLEGKRGLAYQIACALKEIDADLVVPHLPLLRALVLADSVDSPTGRLATELEQLYSSFNRDWFEEGPPAWSQGLSLLLVAATLNPALIAPGTGASAVLRYRHLAGNLNSLYALCELVTECGERLQGQSLSPSAFKGHRSIEAWNNDLDSLRAEVREWRAHAPRMTMKFGPATAVWQKWHRPDGVITRLLDAVLTEDVSLIPSVSRAMKLLQHPSDFAQLVARTDRQDLKRRRGDDIHAGALTQLTDRAGEAVAYMQRWLDLMEARPSQSDYLTRQLGDLHQKAARLGASLDGELSQFAHLDDGWSLVRAGVACVRSAIRALDSLFDGSQQARGPESGPEFLLGSTLLLAPAIDVDDSFRPLQPAEEVLDALLQLSPSREDWIEAFTARVQRGDCDGAKRILDLPGALPEADSTRLGEVYRVELDHHRETLRSELKGERERLEAALAYGYVDEHERSNLDSILTEITRDFESLTRFQEARRRLAQVSARIQTAKDTKLAFVGKAYQALQLDPSSEVAVRLDRIIRQGDVLTANEYLQRVKAGESLPDSSEDGRDIFSDFFPGKAKNLDAFLEAPGGGLGSVVSLIKRGQDFGGLTFGGVSGAHTKSATDMIEGWQRLKRAEKIDEPSVAGFLSGVGFSSPRVLQVVQARSECEVQVETLCDRTTCPVPQYGSQAAGHYRVVCVFKRLADEDLVRSVSETSAGKPTLVLYFGHLSESRRRELAQVSREKRRTFIVLDEVLLLYLAAERKSRLAALFHCALPFTFVEPYVTTSGLVPPEMFYGRVDELNAVREASGRCFIYGGRQLGKTALLREAERGFHSPRDHRVARWIDLKAEGIGMSREARDIWGVLLRELKNVGVLPKEGGPRKANAEGISDDLKAWLAANPARRILLLLDEADRFLEEDSRLQYPETSRLKNLMDVTNRRFKVVFAGLHNVLRTTEQANHPLAHLGDPIEIGPLLRTGEWRHARELIQYPLSAAGYRFVPDDLMVRILAQTNYYPSLLQLYCAQLLRQLHKPYSRRLDYRSGPRYDITEAVVDETYRTKELRDAISSRFHLTLQLDPRYEVVTYSMAYAVDQRRFGFEEGADSKTIREYSLQWWPEGFRRTSEHEFRILLDEMVGLGVLRHAGDRAYTLRNPNLLLLMGTREDIEAALLKEREQPQEFEPNLYRAQLPGDSHEPLRSPLTFGQEHALTRRENGVTLIAASSAGGLESLERFLDVRVPPEFLRFVRAPLARSDFIRQLELLERRVEGGTTLQVVCQGVDWDADWVRLAVARVERLRAPDRHVRMVFVADPIKLRAVLPELRPQLEGLAVESISLKPWGDTFLRQWLEDVGITGGDVDSRRRLENATGLWPMMLTEALAAAASTEISRVCQAAEDTIGRPESRTRILEQLGVRSQRDAGILGVVADLGELVEEDFPEFRDFFDADKDSVLRALEWAEVLHLAEHSAPRTWQVSPFVSRLLKGS